jgi:hypothetical protein
MNLDDFVHIPTAGGTWSRCGRRAHGLPVASSAAAGQGVAAKAGGRYLPSASSGRPICPECLVGPLRDSEGRPRPCAALAPTHHLTPAALSPGWLCACGWRGQAEALRDGPGGIRYCPGCGGTGGLVLAPMPPLYGPPFLAKAIPTWKALELLRGRNS